MHANQFERADFVMIFQTQLDRFASALHESIEALRLRVATSQPRHRGDVIVFFIALDNDREFAFVLHTAPILAWAKRPSFARLCERARFPNASNVLESRLVVPVLGTVIQ